MARLEVIAGDLISYWECAEITLAMLGLFKAAMVKHIDDPVLLWELLNGMAGDATRTLEPLGYGVAWRVP